MDVTPEIKASTEKAVCLIFPDICPDFLARICGDKNWNAETTIAHILDQGEHGHSYPKRSRVNLKRKREEEANASYDPAKNYDSEERRQQLKSPSYKTTALTLLSQEFPKIYKKNVTTWFETRRYCLFPTVLALHKAMLEWDENSPSLQIKKSAHGTPRKYNLAALDEAIRACTDDGEREALVEFSEARATRLKQQRETEAEKQQEEAEIANFAQAQIDGTIAECGCCFVEYALNRMVHCNGEILHWFCRNCAKQLAESQIGLSKYQLHCMSTDDCAGSFSSDQLTLFLDEKLLIALDRIEQEAVLRMAGIEGLETCPFCPFAAEYPPVEDDREFRCLSTECKRVSCRLCRQETHIPMSCAEALRENGHSARRRIEEAMSDALIRKCNKCGTSFIKEVGCNKMTCTRNGCMNVQCYVCSKSCDYSHFNDVGRGGKAGNCPLFDKSVEKRHEEEVRAAEAEARQRVAEENPDIDADLLEFKASEQVKKEEQKHKTKVPPMLGRWRAGAVPNLPGIGDLRLGRSPIGYRLPVFGQMANANQAESHDPPQLLLAGFENAAALPGDRVRDKWIAPPLMLYRSIRNPFGHGPGSDADHDALDAIQQAVESRLNRRHDGTAMAAQRNPPEGLENEREGERHGRRRALSQVKPVPESAFRPGHSWLNRAQSAAQAGGLNQQRRNRPADGGDGRASIAKAGLPEPNVGMTGWHAAAALPLAVESVKAKPAAPLDGVNRGLIVPRPGAPTVGNRPPRPMSHPKTPEQEFIVIENDDDLFTYWD